MTLPVLFSRRAESALAEIHASYSIASPLLGDAFLAETDRVVARVSRAPLMFPGLYRDVRRARLRRFPYEMFYRVLDDHVRVLALVHARRDPRGWPVREARLAYGPAREAA